MTKARRAASVIVAAAITLVGFGCGETTSGDCSDKGTCAPDAAGPDVDNPGADAATEGGLDGSRDASLDITTADGAPCDVTKTPKDDPCVLNDAVGVFVSHPGG